ncbi:MAG TPA: (d)CMP kinase [Chitinophagales bacterium]|nr:(d)CMP kinase [Chitinophagales bacterium]
MSSNKIIIAIDGHSGCGKSTTAKAIARKLGYTYIDTGAMYRAVTLFFLNNEVDTNDHTAVSNALSQIKIDFRRNPESQQLDTYLNGENVEQIIRSPKVASSVSTVAAISDVRKTLVQLQKEIAKNKGVVMDGRDIGTVVFPEAECKFFMTANIDVRAERRLKELNEKGITSTLQEVKDNLEQRDDVDSNRVDSPLVKADDAILIDTSYITVDEQIRISLDHIHHQLEIISQKQENSSL